MGALTHALIGALLPLPVWFWLRWQVAARFSAWVMLDATPWLAGYLILLGVSARPLLSGGAIAGAMIFIGIAQFAKRATLRDGLVFTDGGLLWQVFAHPRFYLPFVPRPVLALGIAAGIALTAFVLVLEPGLDLHLMPGGNGTHSAARTPCARIGSAGFCRTRAAFAAIAIGKLLRSPSFRFDAAIAA